MAEYIDREAFLAFLKSKNYSMASIKTIREYPTVDVVIMKHGKWEQVREDDNFKCSICGAKLSWWNIQSDKYCYNCGAKMDGE